MYSFWSVMRQNHNQIIKLENIALMAILAAFIISLHASIFYRESSKKVLDQAVIREQDENKKLQYMFFNKHGPNNSTQSIKIKINQVYAFSN